MEQETVARYCGVHILDNPFSVDGVFHYYIPDDIADTVIPGAFVTAPFGRGNRKLLGVVVEIGDISILPDRFLARQIKSIDSVCHKNLFLSPRQLDLCSHLVETTLCTTGEAVRAIVPASALASLTEFYSATPDDSRTDSRRAALSSPDLLVLEYICARGTVSTQAVKNHFGAKATASLDRLREKKLLTRELTVRQPEIPTITYYSLALPAGEIEAILRRAKGAPRVTSELHKKILSTLLSAKDRMSASDLREATGATAFQFKSLVCRGLISATTEETYRTPPVIEEVSDPPPFDLSDEQAAAVSTLDALAATGKPRAALLHGVTGSGKTCVILEMIDRTLKRGKGVIVLLPEISLTPQMLHIFQNRYGRRVAVMHSALSAGERFDSYRRIRDGEAPLVVGTRSAVFSPLPNLGMIVMDEEQEHTYKSDQNPKYHARDIARYRCAAENALLLLASATPSLESYQKAMDGKYTLVTMKNRYGTAKLPDVRIVDMRGTAGGGSLSPLGNELASEVSRVKDEGNQTILFLNRRGYSHQTVCRSCGKAISCSRCSVAMNYHVKKNSHEGELVCHWCGGRRPVPTTCPDCGSTHLVRMGYGTQRVEEELKTTFPSARVLRMDADTTSQKDAYDRLLGEFRNHEADILLGTQMVTKGHDFPDVTLVGVLMADMSLYLDDYRAAERTFSMLTQVIGRAGRGDKPGLAIIQTMNPDSDVIRLACAQDYEQFFQNEIRLRRLLQFPPFCDIVLLTLTSRDEKELQKASVRLSRHLMFKNVTEYRDVPIVAFGPFEAPVYRVDNVYRMRMVVKCRLNKRARTMFEDVLIALAAEERGSNRPALSIDFNPSNI